MCFNDLLGQKSQYFTITVIIKGSEGRGWRSTASWEGTETEVQAKSETMFSGLR